MLQGRVFVDRDPKHFRLILNFLRDGTAALPSDPIELQEIKQEAEFFQVKDMQSNSKHEHALRGTLSCVSISCKSLSHLQCRQKSWLHSSQDPFCLLLRGPEQCTIGCLSPGTPGRSPSFDSDSETEWCSLRAAGARCAPVSLQLEDLKQQVVCHDHWKPQGAVQLRSSIAQCVQVRQEG